MLEHVRAHLSGIITTVVGLTLLAVGFDRFDPLERLGGLLVMLGALLYFAAELARIIKCTNRPADVAWQEGYDLGYERAMREVADEHRSRVVSLRAVNDD